MPAVVAPAHASPFHRSNDFPHVKAECLGVRERVGVTEIANFAKFEFSGPGAERFPA